MAGDTQSRHSHAAMDTHVADEVLLERLAEGSHPAFQLLVERHAERFYRLAWRYLSQREEAEDAVQEAFLKLWERPEIWCPGGDAKFTTWFYRVVANLCMDRQRKQRTLPLPEGFDLADSAASQEENAIAGQAEAQLEAAIRALPERQQMALNLCFYEGISNKEAAEIMQVNLKALESLIMRAKNTLKEKLNTTGAGYGTSHRHTA